MSSDKPTAAPEAAPTPEDNAPPVTRDAAPGGTRGRLVLLLVLAAAGAGGYLYWKLQQPVRPPTVANFEEPRPSPAASLAPGPDTDTIAQAAGDTGAGDHPLSSPPDDGSLPAAGPAADAPAPAIDAGHFADEDRVTADEVGGNLEDVPSLAGDLPQPPASLPAVETPAAAPAFDTEAMLARIADLEASVAALSATPAPSSADRANLALAEAGDLVALAGQRLALARDVDGASAALRLAAARLPSAGFQAPRRAIFDDLAALDAFRDADVAALSAELAALARQALSLPIAAPDDSASDADAGTPPAVSGWRELLAAVGASLRGLVEVRATDASRDPLLNPAHAALARQQLALDLSAARVAALQRDAGEFRAALAPAIAALQTQFDGADDAVSTALARLRELGELDLSPPLPSLARSTDALAAAATTGPETAL